MEKQIRFTRHATDRMAERGASADEVTQAIREGARETVREGRHRFRLNLQYGALWQGKYYAIKQVAPVSVEEADAMVVITVYTFYY